jgi:hypothetical protein
MADGTTVDSANRVQQRQVEPPPPPPPPPKVEPQQKVQQQSDAVAAETAANERRGDASRNLLAQRTNAGSEPPQPGRNSTRVAAANQAERALAPVRSAPVAPAKAEQAAAQPEQPAAKPAEKPPEGSAASRFLGGLWSGVKSGVVGVYEGAKALVTDPVGTAKALGSAVAKGAEATADYAKRLATNPSETLQQTADWAGKNIEDIKNAKAEDWGNFIGQTAVGAVGGYGAGKALQGVRALRAAQVAAKAPDVTPNARPPVNAPDARPPANAPEARPPANAPEARPPASAPEARPAAAAPQQGRDLLRNPKSTDPMPNQKITEAGLHRQGGITRAEGESINRFRDALNAHNDKFGLNRDLPPSAASSADTAKALRTSKNPSLGEVHAEIRRTDDAVNKHLSPNDLAGRVKEQRGVNTGFDHVRETQNAYQNLKSSVARIDEFLAKNPNLPESQARYLLDRRNGHAGLVRNLETHLGFK